MNALLKNAIYKFDQNNDIWCRPNYVAINYSDGDDVEQRIETLIAQATDLSVLSVELRQHCTYWPSLYHLSGNRANILRPFENMLQGASVLEVGSGCGAITRYLGESGANVLALEGSLRRAKITRSRTRDLKNVTVVCERLDQLDIDCKFDLITLIGVLEYANLFLSDDNPPLAMLRQVRSLLKPGGKLIIAIENQFGLKYFAGAPEDHIGQPMYGIEGSYRKNQPQTFGRQVLTKLLNKADFPLVQFMSPFPDYKLPVSILTEAGFAAKDFDAGALAWQSVRRDTQLPYPLAFSPELAWPDIFENGLALDLANSFLIIASPLSGAPDDRQKNRILAYHYSTDRIPRYCKETLFLRDQNGKITVRYNLFDASADQNNSGAGERPILRHVCPEQAPYVVGKPFSERFVRIVTQEGWSFEDLAEYFRGYLEVVKQEAMNEGVSISSITPSTTLPGSFFDVVPQNIIIQEDNSADVIDKEWQLSFEIEIGHLVFRSIRLLMDMLSRLCVPRTAREMTLFDFINNIFLSLEFKIDEEDYRRYLKLEATINQAATGRSPSKVLNYGKDHVLPILNLNQFAKNQKVQIARLHSSLMERDNQLVSMIKSRSWRVTAPLRCLNIQKKIGIERVRQLRQTLRRKGGISGVLRKTIFVIRNEGLTGVWTRLGRGFHPLRVFMPSSKSNGLSSQPRPEIIPYYLNPENIQHGSFAIKKPRIAIHLHLFYLDMLNEFASRLQFVPCPFDLYVSVPHNRDVLAVRKRLQRFLNAACKIVVEKVPNKGRDLAPLIIQFGERLLDYEIIAHFHTKKSPCSVDPPGWCQKILDLLIGPPEEGGNRVQQILGLLLEDAKYICAENSTHVIRDRSGWGANHVIAKSVLERHGAFSVDDFPVVDFPEGAMFWARANCMAQFLKMKLNWDDFPDEPIPADGTLVHALERLMLIFSSRHPGRIYRLHSGDSIKDYREHEEQIDFSGTLKFKDVKVLAYYLPQFHAIPENDLWHGKGFTEWTKVRAANPLFKGHYQQHIPHPDIGYYLLDTPETLRKQAGLMKKSGVFGQVFYHYWFSGKLILEKPAQMLLNTPDIDMPFCFCWANENWTRRWDGNEDDILLKQDYSDQDAKNFIHYLIPFFKDPRYVQTGNRPVLFVYRPASLPDARRYLEIWAQECSRHFIEPPYVVAVLTRGASDPRDFGMDAGVERVLHDWTDGAVSDMKKSLRPYRPLGGSVLPYDQVADFYTAQTQAKDFTWFRSLVPFWDNTARYGNDALVVHGSTPYKFSQWLKKTIAFSRNNLPEDRRFVLINAWNEWAEGAHLEPDSRYGYAYLNAVGRTLTGAAYGALSISDEKLQTGIPVRLVVADEPLALLQRDAVLRQRFLSCLSKSTFINCCNVEIQPQALLEMLPEAMKAKCELTASVKPEYILQVRKVAVFFPDLFEKMLQTAVCSPGSVVMPKMYDQALLIEVNENGSVDSTCAHEAPFLLLPAKTPDDGYKNFRVCVDGCSFIATPNSVSEKEMPEVTTIIRCHHSGKFEMLKKALYSLAAMQDCHVVPLIAAQDFTDKQTARLNDLIAQLPWRNGRESRVLHFQSRSGQEDLRSKMLNHALKKVTTRYVGFLDYDDLLMSHAYSWLLSRLNQTGKAVAFGRVFSTTYDCRTDLFLMRKKEFTNGFCYNDFFINNHAPIHSFLLDLSQLSLDQVVYHEDQRYLEDYYLTLQLLTPENTDWDSLRQNVFIGDYMHFADSTNTLALEDIKKKQALISDPEYMRCQHRVDKLRHSLR